MPAYSILTHDYPHHHWDLLLDPGDGGLLWTWRLASPPDRSTSLEAHRQPDHRRIYLDYSGPISGNRGTVAIWDQGEYSCQGNREIPCPPDNFLKISCHGRILKGDILLSFREGDHWIFEYLPDKAPPQDLLVL